MQRGEFYWGGIAITGACAAIEGAMIVTAGTSVLMGALMTLSGLVILGGGGLGCARLQSPEPNMGVVISVTALATVSYFCFAAFRLL